MPERHTGENPANKLKSAVAEFNLDGKDSKSWLLLYFVKELYYLELGYSLKFKNPLSSTSFNGR
jgi:hypothetical protein